MKRMNRVVPTKLCVICQEEKFVMNVVQHSGCSEGVICKACIEKTPVTLLVNCPICRQKTDEFKSRKKTKIHPTKKIRSTNTLWALLLGIKFETSSFPVIIGFGFVTMILAWLFTACCQAMADADARHRRRVDMSMGRRHWERNLATRQAYDDIPV